MRQVEFQDVECLKWAGALAAVGVVGVGLGFGGDLLIRPSITSTTTQQGGTITETATKTLTQLAVTQTTTLTQTSTQTASTTATQTVTAPPPTLSYVPPLSPSVQARVNQIVQSLVGAHSDETSVYQAALCGAGEIADPCKVILKNGLAVGVVPEDLVNPTIAREDAYLSQEDLQKGRIRGVPWSVNWVFPWNIQLPTRVLYPMKRTGPRARS